MKKFCKFIGSTLLSIVQYVLLCTVTVFGAVAGLVALLGIFTASLFWVILTYLNPKGCEKGCKIIQEFYETNITARKEEQ